MARSETPYNPDAATLRLLEDLRDALAEGKRLNKEEARIAARKEQLIKKLKAKGLTNKRIAQEAGVSLTIVNRLMYGRKR